MRVKSNSDATFEERILGHIENAGPIVVRELYTRAAKDNPSLTKIGFADVIWRLAEQGRLYLEEVPPIVKSLPEFLTLWERNLSLYGSIAISLLTIAVVCSLPSGSPFVPLRWALGFVFVLFIPGYVTLKVLFPARILNGIERFTLSIGLSLVLVPLVALLLNFTPWGIQLITIVISLFLFTTGLSTIALAREYLRLASIVSTERK